MNKFKPTLGQLGVSCTNYLEEFTLRCFSSQNGLYVWKKCIKGSKYAVYILNN